MSGIFLSFFGGANPTFAVSQSTASVNEGSSVTFTVTTTNVSNGTTLYFSTNVISGTVNSSDFSDSTLTGSFTITNNTATITRTLANDDTTEGSESFQLQVRTGSTSGTIVATSSTVTIGDTSLNPTIISIKLWGAGGGASQGCNGYDGNSNGAGGGFVYAQFGNNQLVTGDVLRIMVGQGGSANGGSRTYGGGAPKGGDGGASGGGGSYIGLNTPSVSHANMILAAGGGGGGSTGTGETPTSTSYGGGAGGGTTGNPGSGGGGSQVAGGAQGTGGFGGGGSPGQDGYAMNGGYGMSCKGSGGGGGYYGGGGGHGDCGACSAGAAGGGSSYVSHPKVATVYNNDRAWGSEQNPVAKLDPDWISGGSVYGVGDFNGNPGYCIIIVNGTKYSFGYTGSDQTFTIP